MTDSSLRLLYDFDACVKRDQEQAPVFLHRRDRKFAMISQEQGKIPSPKRWLAHIEHFSGPGATTSPSSDLIKFWRRINNSFAAIGLVLGILTMLGLLFYDGGQRINVTVIMAFVVFQFFMAFLTTIQSVVGWQPWRGLLKHFLKQAQSDVAVKLQPVLMGRAAQLGGLCFALSGLAVLLLMVLLEDLAFGWSTTIETDASTYHGLVSVLAAPWAWLWQAAAPDIELVEATRFFRAGNQQENLNPAVWGQWWPFVAMLWATYALALRVVLYMFARFLIGRKARKLLRVHPGMSALMYRMETPLLDTGYDHNDADDLPDTATQLALKSMPKANIMLCWAGAGESALPDLAINNTILLEKVGGSISLAEDQTTLALVAEKLSESVYPNVLIFTRSWEPPTGELEDFIERARELFIKKAHIVIVPLAINTEEAPEQHQVQLWLRFAKRIKGDFVSVSILSKNDDSTNKSAGVET